MENINVTMPTVTTEQMKRIIRAAIVTKDVPMFWGSPGIAKTENTYSVAEEIKREDPNFWFYEIHPVTFDNVDSGGLPEISTLENGKRVTIRTPPDFFRLGGRGMIFVDEYPQATPTVMSSLSKLLLPSNYGCVLEGDVTIVCAGNRETDKAATFKMPSQINLRMSHYELVADPDNWIVWAVNNGIEPELVSFIKLHPELLSVFDPKHKACPNPRAWEMVNRKLRYYKGDMEMLALEIPARVGTAAGQQIISHLRLLSDLPDVDRCINEPTKAPLPVKRDIEAILCTALAYKATVNNIGDIFTYINRLPTMEMAALFITVAAQRNEKLRYTPAWVKWCVDNKLTN